jgi:hypothetical protein
MDPLPADARQRQVRLRRRAVLRALQAPKWLRIRWSRQGSVVIGYSPAMSRAGIESLREYLDAALRELAVWNWNTRAPDPDPTPPDFYAGLREQLMRARTATTIQQLDAAVQQSSVESSTAVL